MDDPGSDDLVRGGDAPRSRSSTVLAFLAGLLAAVLYVASAFLVLFAQVFAPNEGQEQLVAIAKTVDGVVWLGIGVWLVADWIRLRARVLAAAVAAWIWAYALLGFVASHGAWGY